MTIGGSHSSGVILMNLTKKYRDVFAVKKLDLEIKRGEFLTILGPSGSGKTTTLMMIAGFVKPNEGKILIGDGEDISRKPSYKRDIGMVFQNYALFPHMTVFDNIAFPLRMRKISEKDIRSKVESSLELVQLDGFADRFQKQLSGGQSQRVALARAIVFEPAVLLMDEPLGALDRKLREYMQLELKHIHEQLGLTIISVTHDQGEALTMSDRIAVMDQGKLVQVAKPKGVYESPSNIFAADFIGKSNLIDGVVKTIETGKCILTLKGGQEISATNPGMLMKGQNVTFQIRPEKISIYEIEDPIDNILECCIEDVVYLGEITRYIVNLGDDILITVSHLNKDVIPEHRKGDKVKIGWRIQHTKLFQ